MLRSFHGMLGFLALALAVLAGCGGGDKPKQAVSDKPVATFRGQPVSHWAAALKDRDADYRTLAASALQALGADAADAVPVLTEALADESATVRAGAAMALSAIGAPARPAERALNKLLEDSDPMVRSSAVLALGEVTGAPSVDTMVTALKDESPRVREMAAGLLSKMGGAAAPALIKLAQEKDDALRVLGIQILGRIKSADAVPMLATALGDSETAVRNAAIISLSQVGEPSIPALAGAMTDAEVTKRWSAAYALNLIGNAKVAPALVVGLNDKDPRVRDLSTTGLTRMGKEAVDALAAAAKNEDAGMRQMAINALGVVARPEAVPALAAAVKDADPSVREAAVTALGYTGSDKAVPSLTEAITSDDLNLRAVAVPAFARLGKPGIDALSEVCKHSQWQVRRAAVDSLGMMALPEVVPTLNRMVPDQEPRVRVAAAMAIAKVGPAAKSSITPLVNGLGDANDEVRESSAIALARIAPGNDTAIPAIVKALREGDARTKAGASMAIARLGPLAPAAVDPLISALKDADQSVVTTARLALVKLGYEAVPGLVKALRGDDVESRVLVMGVLGQIGPDAAAAADMLVYLLQDPSQKVRDSAVYALGQLGTEAKAALIKASRGEDKKLAAVASEALETILKQ